MIDIEGPRQATPDASDAEALIRQARRRQRLRRLVVLGAVLLVIAGVLLSTHLLSSAKKPASLSSAREGSGSPRCTPTHLKVGDLGGSAGTGTGILTIRLTN